MRGQLALGRPGPLAVHPPGGRRRSTARRVDEVEKLGVAPGKELLRVDRHAVDDELTERAQELGDAVRAAVVAGDCEVWPTFENP